MISLLFLLVASAFAAVDDLRVIGSTQTQILLAYTAPSAAACTLEASVEPDFTPLADDVDPSKFPQSDLDSRSGNLSVGRMRYFVVGKQGPAALATAYNGYRMSRALLTDTDYYFRVTCGGDTATAKGRTSNIPTGDTRGEALAVSSDRPWAYDTVTSNTAAYGDFADPYTGAQIRRPTSWTTFGYGGSTATNGNGDCNRTLSGVKGSCLFTDAAGTGWAATSGTLTDAVRASDSNFAEYSGTTQQPLFIRLGTGKYPTSSTPETLGGMAFQNIILQAQTTDATGEGGQFEMAITFDGVNAYSPWLKHTLSDTSLATVRFCKDVPCSAADAPGDTMVDRWPLEYEMIPDAKVYNESGSETTHKFVGAGAQAYCDSLYVGQYYASLDDGNAVRWNTVTAKSCGSTPPQITVAAPYAYQHSGTAGVTIFRLAQPLYNPLYGILVRKSSTTSGSTIKIGYALWRMARSTSFTFALGSGGFGKRCQNVLTAQGEYLCQLGNHIVGISYTANGIAMSNYGFTYVRGSYLVADLNSQESYGCMGNASTSDSTWSDTEAGVFYCLMGTTYPNPAAGGAVDGRYALVKLTLDTSAPFAAADPDSTSGVGLGAQANRIAFTDVEILTPCLSGCSSVNDDYTLPAQFLRYAPTYDKSKFGACAIGSVQGKNIVIYCLSGSQDSHGWYFVMDVGNGLPIGSGFVGSRGNTQQTYGGFLMSECQAGRFCAVHTYQGAIEAGGAKYAVMETGAKCPLEVTATVSLPSCSSASSPGSCSACPNVTLDGVNYSGKNWCSNLQITSSWSGAWGSTPAGFEDGDPIAPNGCDNGAPGLRYWGQKLAVGDYLYHDSERVRIIQRNNNGSFEVIRGWGSACTSCSSASSYAAKAHSNGVTWQTRCGAIVSDPTLSDPEFAMGVAWWFEQDPGGTNPAYTYLDIYQNHALHVENLALRPEYEAGTYDKTSAASLKAPSNTTISLPNRFAGASSASCAGNGCEKHPAYGQILGNANAKSWFVDVHPRLSHGQTGSTAIALVAGKSHIYKWQSSATRSVKHFDFEVYSALHPFRRVDTISDSVSDAGRWCHAVIANDCFSGSEANTQYLVHPAFDTYYSGSAANGCREAEFGTLNGDICLGNTVGISASTAQWRVPTLGTVAKWLNGIAARVVAKYARTYREAATENAKVDPEGYYLFARGAYYVQPPRFPENPGSSSSTFVAVPISAAGPAGTSTAIVEFGYDGTYACSRNRGDVCIAESAALNETTPYLWAQETITGLACGSGCTITVPAIRNRVLYTRVKYRNSGGTVIATEVRPPMAVN